MGIKKLNSYLMSNCTHDAITRVPLSHFKGKTLAIDTSIYLYKYLSENTFLESFYTMLSIFRQYNITPTFVFDGKPPVEKNDVIWERYYKRKDAEAKYAEILEDLDSKDLTPEERQKGMEKLTGLKRQFVRITEDNLLHLKQLFANFGVKYVEAEAEADVVCAHLVKSGKAYACVSDDMDMFAYDCPIVLRKLNLFHHNCVMYYGPQIKKELDVDEIQPVLILCGTDYNTGVSWDICTAIERYQFYEKEYERRQTTVDFYAWLLERRFIDETQKEKIDHVYEMFQIPKDLTVNYTIRSKDWTILQPVLEKEGFLFAE